MEDIHQQWKETALYVEKNSGRDDLIIFAGGMGTGIEQKSFDWYYQGTFQKCNLSNKLVGSVAKSKALMQCASEYDRFWAIIRNSTEPSNPVESYRSFFLNLDQSAMQLLDEQQFVDISVFLVELAR